ncbi:DMT family transporter [Clostridiisalibacter paucivorans]|uniref:DMT family transporter n=1 Tax=Clostridiisalibacter paucivorans TaxID=408753 RepID=UPI0004793D4F|nr:DMT family transporter [Clostridiisalibacter paucivorans]
MEKIFTKKMNVFLIALLCMALWGSAFPVLKISYEELQIATEDIFSKLYFAGIRFFIASILVFTATRLIFKVKIDINKKNIGPIVLLGIMQTTLQYFFFYIGVANTSGIKSAILQASGTFFTVIIAHFVYSDDRIDFKKILSLILGFGGIIVVNIGKDFNGSFKLLGEGFLLSAALVSTTATIYVKFISRDINPMILTGGQMFIGSCILLIVGKIGMFENTIVFNKFTGGLLIYAAFLSATAFLLWYTLLKYNKPGQISIYRLFIPIFGSMLSAIFIPNEVLNLKLLMGLLLVVLGIVVLNIDKKEV